MLREFRTFLEKFNVIPIAVGLVLALAFTPVVDSVVAIILSVIGKALGLEPAEGETLISFDSWTPGGIPLGSFVGALISFVLIAFVVFMIIKSLAKAGARTDAAATPDQVLLTEIRDLLAKRNA